MLAVLLAAFLASEYAVVMVSGRYLPTRSQDDKLERLRELLKDVSQNILTKLLAIREEMQKKSLHDDAILVLQYLN